MSCCTNCKSKTLTFDSETENIICTKCAVVQPYNNYQHQAFDLNGFIGTTTFFSTKPHTMRKLYNHKKTKIHPSTTMAMTNQLYLLPLALATLAATLPPQDQQVLAYLISTNNNAKTGGYGGNHPPQFGCNCFTCYTSYWAKWDESPNQQLIHDIIEKYEDGLVCNKKSKRGKRRNRVFHAENEAHAPVHAESESHAPKQVEENKVHDNDDDDDDDDEGDGLMTSLPEKGSVKKIVNFLVGRIWGVWGI